MLLALFDSKFRKVLLLVVCSLVLSVARAQAPTRYEPTIESLNRHPLPQWYAVAKLGIFVHWGSTRSPARLPPSTPSTISSHWTTSLTILTPSGISTVCASAAPRLRPITRNITVQTTTITTSLLFLI